MLKKFSSIMTILILATMMGVCSTSWVMVWICLEISTLAMCWIMAKDSSKEKSQESSPLMYYLIQVMASIVLLATASLEETLASSMVMVAMVMMKMGVWPMHMWYMKLIKTMEMKQTSMVIVMTWQKILPIMLMMSISENQTMKMIILVLALSTLVTPISNLVKSLSVKSIMALSSLNNNGWLMVSAMTSISTFLTFLTLYSSTLVITLKSLNSMTTKKMSKMIPFWSATLLVSNMGGLPPLTMFWSKILVVKTMMMSSIPTELAFILMMTACYFLYHYLWMVSNEVSWSPMKTQNMAMKEKESKPMIWVLATSMLGFLIMLTLGLTKKDLSW